MISYITVFSTFYVMRKNSHLENSHKYPFKAICKLQAVPEYTELIVSKDIL